MAPADPRDGLIFCEHWRCRLSTRACAARHRNAKRGPARYGHRSIEPPGCYDTHCRDCPIGAKNARKERDMRRKQTPPVAYHGTPVENIAALQADHLSLLLGDELASAVIRRAQSAKSDVSDHLRQIVAEYLYLESIGA